MIEERALSATVPAELAGLRLDQVLARLFPDYSRTLLKRWLLAGHVRLDSAGAAPRHRLCGGERIEVRVQPAQPRPWVAQPLPLAVVHEDEDIIVVDKPAGVVVHPGAGNPDGTLLNALLAHDPRLAALPRAGLVHRLDKDTSGLLVVARSLRAHTHLVQALKARRISRIYEAVVTGVPVSGGTVDAAIGRHVHQRTRMAVSSRGRPAVTRFRVRQRFAGHAHLELSLESGRTHQIRVHMAHLGHPLVGDRLYGARPRLPAAAGLALTAALRGFARQALHAVRLGLRHPGHGEAVQFQSPLPADLRELLRLLAEHAKRNPDDHEHAD